MTWLIAEDEADIRNLVALMCQAWGHNPLTFENGQRVWDWLDSIEQGAQITVPELILMDIRMPGKKGNELAHRMRQLSILQRTPIVLMTAYTLSDNERQEMMSNDGVDLILAKPLPDFDQLRTILHNVGEKKHDQVGEHTPIAAQETQETATAPAVAPTNAVPVPTPADDNSTKPTLVSRKKRTGEVKAASGSTSEQKQADEAKQPESDNISGGGKQATS